MKMGEKVYPKVLIIGQTFHKKSGGGITISNLFQGWPKDRIAVASNVNLSYDLDVSVCEQYYQLGYDGKLHPFPINVLLPRIRCGSITHKITSGTKNSDSARPRRFEKIYKLISALLIFLGIYNLLYRLKITTDFNKWITEFNPDIIYSQLSTLEFIRFVTEIHEQFEIPVALHIMDDWPKSLTNKGLLSAYWKKTIDREFRKLLDTSEVLMSICESMSEEYMTRYGKEFTPFHNPIEIGNWLPYSKKQWDIESEFKILYTGRIGKANGKSILFMSSIINGMNQDQNKIILDIFTSDDKTKNASLIKKMRGVRVNKTVAYHEMPTLLASYDLLFLPLDFDKEGILFAQFSMPTKASEYMISGTPVLVYADRRTALAKYAASDSWAYLVSDSDKMSLIRAVNDLYSDYSLRKKLAERARELVIKNEDANIIREKFRKKLLRLE